MDQQQHKFLSKKIKLDKKTPSAECSIVGPIPVHNHQAVVSPLSLPLPRVLTYAHINRIDDHCKVGKPHTIIQINERVS